MVTLITNGDSYHCHFTRNAIDHALVTSSKHTIRFAYKFTRPHILIKIKMLRNIVICFRKNIRMCRLSAKYIHTFRFCLLLEPKMFC